MIIIMGSVTGTPETIDGLLVASLEHAGGAGAAPCGWWCWAWR